MRETKFLPGWEPRIPVLQIRHVRPNVFIGCSQKPWRAAGRGAWVVGRGTCRRRQDEYSCEFRVVEAGECDTT